MKQLMKVTFVKRQEKIMATPQTASDMLAEFPFLASYEHVCQQNVLIRCLILVLFLFLLLFSWLIRLILDNLINVISCILILR
jgi:hypothetical protein